MGALYAPPPPADGVIIRPPSSERVKATADVSRDQLTIPEIRGIPQRKEHGDKFLQNLHQPLIRAVMIHIVELLWKLLPTVESCQKTLPTNTPYSPTP